MSAGIAIDPVSRPYFLKTSTVLGCLRSQDLQCSVRGLGLSDLGFRVEGAGFRFQSLRLRVQGSQLDLAALSMWHSPNE